MSNEVPTKEDNEEDDEEKKSKKDPTNKLLYSYPIGPKWKKGTKRKKQINFDNLSLLYDKSRLFGIFQSY
ncbi:MAG: hypothetical protein ACXAC8_17750 [Candidatus Hodarchaeales archaeon]|jgi:hypothetical protein